MLCLKEAEFQFWDQFPHLDDDDEEFYDDNQTSRGSSNTNYLKHQDMALYGVHQFQDADVVSLITCHNCGMVMRPQAFNAHYRKRHNSSSLLNDFDPSIDAIVPTHYDPPFEHHEHQAKRRRITHSTSSDDSYYSGQSSSSTSAMLSQTVSHNSFRANAQLAAQSTMKTKKQPLASKPEGLKIKMKLKKTVNGSWSVVAWQQNLFRSLNIFPNDNLISKSDNFLWLFSMTLNIVSFFNDLKDCKIHFTYNKNLQKPKQNSRSLMTL